MPHLHHSHLSRLLLPLSAVLGLLVLWTVVWKLHLFHESALPSPLAVGLGFVEEIRNGRLFNDLITSLYRVSVGFLLAVGAGIPT
ncbi:MAG: hypothetical protein JO185_25695, partial [Acidobacteriaceae bacterium]|nr:hypothetical protein [Acidobacteriaceae bacterium]